MAHLNIHKLCSDSWSTPEFVPEVIANCPPINARLGNILCSQPLPGTRLSSPKQNSKCGKTAHVELTGAVLRLPSKQVRHNCRFQDLLAKDGQPGTPAMLIGSDPIWFCVETYMGVHFEHELALYERKSWKDIHPRARRCRPFWDQIRYRWGEWDKDMRRGIACVVVMSGDGEEDYIARSAKVVGRGECMRGGGGDQPHK